jgi:hypothetical protein
MQQLPMVRVLIVAVVVLLVLSVVVAFVVTGGRSTGSPAPAILSRPAALANQIGLQASDLANGKYGSGWVKAEDGKAIPRVPGPCSPLSSGPTLADQSSDVYQSSQGGGLEKVASQVAIMPNAVEAQAALTGTHLATFGTTCVKPMEDQTAQNALQSLNGQANQGCHYALAGSVVTPLGPGTLGANVSGYQYTATIKCPTTGQTQTDSTYLAFEQVGPVCVLVTAIGATSPADVAGLSAVIAARARNLTA